MKEHMMKAVFCKQYGPPEVLKLGTTSRPQPQPKELLIRVKAAAVNSADVRVRGLDVPGILRLVMRIVLGFFGPRRPILGTVFAGVVEEVGADVTLFQPGDEVYAMTGLRFGAYAEYTTFKEKGVIYRKPKTATFEEAAAIVFGGTTAIHFLTKAKLNTRPGSKVLIYGATGSCGTSAIQLAKFYQAHVTAVCSAAGAALARSLGADVVIDYTKDDFTQAGQQYDVIFDAVGKISKKASAKCLAKQGAFVTVGGMDTAAESKAQLQLLGDLFDRGLLKAVIDKTYALDDIVAAHRYVDTGRKKGNVVIVV
jgi:NADPH:quinone reductase-like Zn-dependent oxidoreductase